MLAKKEANTAGTGKGEGGKIRWVRAREEEGRRRRKVRPPLTRIILEYVSPSATRERISTNANEAIDASASPRNP